MPRPKKSGDAAGEKKAKQKPKADTNSIEAIISKEYGHGVVLTGRQIVDKPKAIIPVSPALDLAHSGGWQEGSFITLIGPPRSGKTTTALHFAARAQKPEWGGRKVVFCEAEARLEKRDLTGIPGLEIDDPDKFIRIGPSPPVENADGTTTPGKILTAEEYLTIIGMYLERCVGLVLILDSISILCEEAEWIGGVTTETRGGAQKIFARFMRRMAQVIPTNRHIFVGTVHLMANTSGRGSPNVAKMANSADYGLFTMLRATHFEFLKEGESGHPYGQKVHWRCDRSPIGPPGIKVESYLRYGEGIDEIAENIEFGEQMKFIDKSGAWYTLPFIDGGPKAQGKNNLRQLIKSHPEWAIELDKKVRQGLGLG